MKYILFIILICIFSFPVFAQDERGSAIFMNQYGDDIGAVALSFHINNAVEKDQDKTIKKTQSVYDYKLAVKVIFNIQDEFFLDKNIDWVSFSPFRRRYILSLEKEVY